MLHKPAAALAAALLATALACSDRPHPLGPDLRPQAARGGGHEEGAGNNLSFPVIWSDGVAKTLRGTAGVPPQLEGAWWWVWGDTGGEHAEPLACAPSRSDPERCADGSSPGAGARHAYLQKDALNVWQASSFDGSGSPVNVDFIDWGDNLESVAWSTSSMVRVETVLYKELEAAATQYAMSHVSGRGMDEVWGLSTDAAKTIGFGPGTRATVYTPCARLTIQKLTVPRDQVSDAAWDAASGQWIGSHVRPAFFNKAVFQAADGPGYYNAEVNVKGMVIYGYTWSVKDENDMAGGTAAGHYRVTFSLDGGNCTNPLNAYFVDGVTAILAAEDGDTHDDGGAGAGGLTYLDPAHNLTYVDVQIGDDRGGRGGSGGSGGGGGGGGNGWGGGRG